VVVVSAAPPLLTAATATLYSCPDAKPVTVIFGDRVTRNCAVRWSAGLVITKTA
jgi:hypothetical protein